MKKHDTPQVSDSEGNPGEEYSETSSSDHSGSNTLERVVNQTDEMAHLNQLILLHLEKCGGFTTQDAYFTLVHPVLDLLEEEIRTRIHPGITIKEMKLVVQDWIDCEIVKLRKSP